MSYAANKRWRLAHRECRNAQRKRYYDKTTPPPGLRRKRPWDHVDERLILESELTDMELAARLDRSVRAIQIQRCKIKAGIAGSVMTREWLARHEGA